MPNRNGRIGTFSTSPVEKSAVPRFVSVRQSEGEVPEIVLSFFPPADPISMNEGDSWKVRNSAKLWRDAAYWHWIACYPSKGPSQRAFGTEADIFVSLPFETIRRRDPINYAKTVKHIVDGFVLAGAWPDDTNEYVTQHIPVLTVTDSLVIVRITKRQNEHQQII